MTSIIFAKKQNTTDVFMRQNELLSVTQNLYIDQISQIIAENTAIPEGQMIKLDLDDIRSVVGGLAPIIGAVESKPEEKMEEVIPESKPTTPMDPGQAIAEIKEIIGDPKELFPDSQKDQEYIYTMFRDLIKEINKRRQIR